MASHKSSRLFLSVASGFSSLKHPPACTYIIINSNSLCFYFISVKDALSFLLVIVDFNFYFMYCAVWSLTPVEACFVKL